MTTKAQARALVRRLHGKNADVREQPNASTPAERAEIQERGKARRARKDEIDARLKALAFRWDEQLLRAAQFVCAVDAVAAAGLVCATKAPHPSVMSLRAAVSVAKEYLALKDERADLEEAGKRDSARLWQRRCEAVKFVSMPGLGGTHHVLAEADSWGELVAKLQPAKEPSDAAAT